MFKRESKTSKILSIVLIISILLAIGTTAYIIIKPKQGETFTEFYILGPGGQASNYPTNLTVGQNASVIIGIVNHEQKTVNYNLVITSNGNIMSDKNIHLQMETKPKYPIPSLQILRVIKKFSFSSINYQIILIFTDHFIYLYM